MSLDENGYPTPEAIAELTEAVAVWPGPEGMNASARRIMALARSCWHYPDYWREEHRPDELFDRMGTLYTFSTGGWSGNEEVVGVLQGRTPVEGMFWSVFWETHRKGGHYALFIPDGEPAPDGTLKVR